MNQSIYTITVQCPWCRIGETMADKPADVNISCQCHNCGHYYSMNFKTRRAIRAKPAPKANSPNRAIRRHK